MGPNVAESLRAMASSLGENDLASPSRYPNNMPGRHLWLIIHIGLGIIFIFIHVIFLGESLRWV
jgi:hypothetical protein